MQDEIESNGQKLKGELQALQLKRKAAGIFRSVQKKRMDYQIAEKEKEISRSGRKKNCETSCISIK